MGRSLNSELWCSFNLLLKKADLFQLPWPRTTRDNWELTRSHCSSMHKTQTGPNDVISILSVVVTCWILIEAHQADELDGIELLKHGCTDCFDYKKPGSCTLHEIGRKEGIDYSIASVGSSKCCRAVDKSR